MVTVTHTTPATLPNNPEKEISSDAWNEEHTVEGLAAVASTGAYGDLSGLPELKAVATSGAYGDLTGKPALKAVSTSGVYGDLTSLPALKTVATSGVYADLTSKPALQAVATSGAYGDLSGLPSLGTVASTAASLYSLTGHRHDASHVTSGVFDTARLASSGTANASTVLYGNQTWGALPAGEGSGTVTQVAFSSAVAGLTVTGSPVSSAGTITLSGTYSMPFVSTALLTAMAVTTNTFTTACSLSLSAGTWLVQAQMLIGRNTASSTRYTARLFDGSNISSGQGCVPGVTSTYTQIGCSAIVIYGATSTLSWQAAGDVAPSFIRPAAFQNTAGSTATMMMATRIR